MSIKQPIYHEFDLNATSGNSRVISLTHTDDAHVDAIELCVKQQGAPVDITGATVIARMVLHGTTDVLLNDSVPCTINDAGNILIPFDNAAVQTRKGIVKIEVNITRDPDILTLQLPLWVKINGSILDDATVDPHSEGTIPELLKDAADALEEATQALEDAKDYDNLENKPQINSVTLLGNKSSDDLGLQKKLTAGTNITLESDGTISAATGRLGIYGRTGIDTYPIVSNIDWFGLEGQFSVSYDNVYNRYNINIGDCIIKYDPDFPMIHGKNRLINAPINTWGRIRGDDSDLRFFMPPNSNGGILLTLSVLDAAPQLRFQIVINNDGELYTRKYLTSDTTVVWKKCGSQLISAVVNQNGTITFTDSDGNTFTTSGTSVIGADGFSPTATVTQTASGATVSITDKNGTTTANISNGADGQDYVLTSQDKTDIANIVLGELPTTQGVLYGNTSN